MLVRKFSLVILIFLLANSKCQGQTVNNQQPPKAPTVPFTYALSTTYLTYLARTEQEIYHNMRNYRQILKERMRLIDDYLVDYEDSSLKGISHLPDSASPWEKATQVAVHPITAYRMIRRFATEFDKIGHHASNGKSERELHDSIVKLSSAYGWPSVGDLKDAMDAILRLHYTYNLNIDQFSNGHIMGIPTNVEFPAAQMLQIAEYATKSTQYNLAMDWLEATDFKVRVQQNETGANPTGISPADVDNAYLNNIEKHDSNFERNLNASHMFMYTERLKENPLPVSLRDHNYEKLKGLNKSQNQAEAAKHYNFLALCNGEDFQTPRYKASLKCWYDKRNPYFYLFPLKAELLNRKPLLIQFHDVISDQWTQEMKKAAIPTLQRAPQNVVGATPRTATYAWLLDEHIPKAPLSRRIELITGLNVRGRVASEDLQIASYAYGGHVSTHVDSLGGDPDKDPILIRKGNRVTTFLVYLNDVEKGGYTAFPLLGTHVKPSKGSAVLWYTSLKNGQIDGRMIHGACPIVLGHKWIATKWTHLNQNFLKRPCGLRSDI